MRQILYAARVGKESTGRPPIRGGHPDTVTTFAGSRSRCARTKVSVIEGSFGSATTRRGVVAMIRALRWLLDVNSELPASLSTFSDRHSHEGATPTLPRPSQVTSRDILSPPQGVSGL